MKLTKKRRIGVSSVVSAAFLVLVVMSGYLLTTYLNQKTWSLTEIIDEEKNFDYERSKEQFTAVGIPFTESNTLDITVKNKGEIEVDLKWITVRDAITLKPVLDFQPIDYRVRPGDSVNEVGKDILDVFPGGYEETVGYVIQLWSERGTVSSYKYPPLPKEYRLISNKLYSGPFEFDQEISSFQYTSEANPVTPQPAYEMYDYFDQIIYEIKLKNVENRTVEIQATSFLLIIVPQIAGTGETELYNHIVDQSSSSNVIISYVDYSQPVIPGEIAVLKFGCQTPRGTDFLPDNSLLGYQGNSYDVENLVTTYLIIFWKFQDTTIAFGQTIPLASILVNP